MKDRVKEFKESTFKVCRIVTLDKQMLMTIIVSVLPKKNKKIVFLVLRMFSAYVANRESLYFSLRVGIPVLCPDICFTTASVTDRSLNFYYRSSKL